MVSDNFLKPEHSELGKKSEYDSHYSPEKLFPIPRKDNRIAIGLHAKQLPFYGYDVWNHYEVSWLNARGKPIVAVAEIIYGCESPNIIESKSMKLYFNSFNNTKFTDIASVQATIARDLSMHLGSTSLLIRLIPVSQFQEQKLIPRLDGICIDELDVECNTYHTDPSFLITEDQEVQETLYTDLLKSNCLVTNQPDWCSIQITYKGNKINQPGLLKYIVSFRNDNEFHEQCVEKIFMHVLQYCRPSELTVYGRSTRRGGLDINSIRSSKPIDPEKIPNIRLCRQ
jgi:7-cyano-7-deazaguanine reductase